MPITDLAAAHVVCRTPRIGTTFYGDLSLPAKAAPLNQIPVISAFTSDKTSDNAPLTVNFAVAEPIRMTTTTGCRTSGRPRTG